MNVQVISDTIQKFNSFSYYLCGAYYQRKGKRLHRTVWEYHNGEIPKGYHVHHIDGDRANNQISNLALLKGHDHLSGHMSSPERKEQSRECIKEAVKAAAQWHGSEQGNKWHSEHMHEYWRKAPLRTYICDNCKKEYQSKAVRYIGNHFCCNNCKAAFRRKRQKNENKEN